MGASANPTKAWTRLLGTSLDDRAHALTTGTDGTIYMAGLAGGSLDGQANSVFGHLMMDFVDCSFELYLPGHFDYW